jgi:hypothetical protein
VAELIEMEILDSSLLIFLLEIDAIFVDGIVKMDYKRLQSALLKTKTVRWVTRLVPLNYTRPQQNTWRMVRPVIDVRMADMQIRPFGSRLGQRGAWIVTKASSASFFSALFASQSKASRTITWLLKRLQICRVGEYYAAMDKRVAKEVSSPVEVQETQLNCETTSGASSSTRL